MDISMIVAMASNRCIGMDNALPWRLSADLKHFKALTTGHHIIMGRRTFESIGKPLPNRVSVVVSRNAEYAAPGCVVVTCLEDAFALAAATGEAEAFVIGGAQIYALALPHASRLYLTEVDAEVEGDAFFPALPESWQELSRQAHEADAKNEHNYAFVVLER